MKKIKGVIMMKNKRNFLKKSIIKGDIITKGIEQARDMTYWFSERF